MLNSVETITKTSCSLICEVFLEMLIFQKEANLLSRTIDAVFFSGITVSCSLLLSLFQDDEMLFHYCKRKTSYELFWIWQIVLSRLNSVSGTKNGRYNGIFFPHVIIYVIFSLFINFEFLKI